jgi:N-acetylmuramoyl-L-alanine amidase
LSLPITELPSPNCDGRSGGAVSMLVLHYTGMQTPQAAFERLRDSASKVSAHYIVDEEGGVFRLVEENKRAWHAGLSCWRGHKDINQISIGIELINPGHEWGYRAFPEKQMTALIALCKEILARHPDIVPRNVVGHSDIAPMRKEDPGEKFDWKRLAKEGIGLWPEVAASAQPLKINTLALQRNLLAFGYDVPQSGDLCAVTKKAVTAFQRHFRQNKITGQWDSDCQNRLAALLKMI